MSRLSHFEALVLDVAVTEGQPRSLLSAWNSAYASSSPATHPRLTVRPRGLRIPPSDSPFADTPVPSFITDLTFALAPGEVHFVEGYQMPLPHLDAFAIESIGDLDVASLTALAVVVAKSRLRSFVCEGLPLDGAFFDRLWSPAIATSSIFLPSFPRHRLLHPRLDVLDVDR